MYLTMRIIKMGHIEQKGPGLPGMAPLEPVKKQDEKEVKATKYMADLNRRGFIGHNELYLRNYVNSDLGIALAHIRQNYIKYVIEGHWSEDKFNTAIAAIISKYQLLTAGNFMRAGRDFDLGKLSMTKLALDTPEDDLTDDELGDILSSYYK